MLGFGTVMDGSGAALGVEAFGFDFRNFTDGLPEISSAEAFGFGFDFGSYIWRGSGLYTQLWAMHLFFISTACLYRFLSRGTGYLAAVFACSALVLSDLLYAYIMGVTALIIFFFSIGQARQR